MACLEIAGLDSRLGLIMADFPFLRVNRIQPRLTSTEYWWVCLAPRAGFEPATRSNYSSVARVTAVHTFGRLPQAADRAILPLRTPRIPGIGREPGILCPGQWLPEKLASLNLPNNMRERLRITVRD